MMIGKICLSVVCATLFVTSAQAGIPVEEEVECPIGDQVLTVTSTLSCTSFGAMMNLTRQSSCDFVTRVPDCTETGLPLYRPFSDAELPKIEAYLASEGFAALKETSRFQRAYAIERALYPDGPHANAFYALVEAYQEDPGMAEDPEMMGFAKRTAERILETETPGTDALLAMLSVAAWEAYAGREAQARAWLGTYKAEAPGIIETLEGDNDTRTADYFSDYAAKLESCLSDLTIEGCRADDPVQTN